MGFLKSVNLPITLIIFLLLSVGITVISSSSPTLAIQQASFAIVGALVYFFIASTDYRVLTNLIKPAYVIIILLLILVFIIGIETRGSIRWIPLGSINIQPSEFAKPVLILLLADFWSKRKITWRNILHSLFWIVPILGLVFKQPDLGTTLTLGSIWLGTIFAAGISLKKGIILLLSLLLIIPLSLKGLADYQKQRLTSFLSPQDDPLGVGYNIIQSTIAIGSGEFLGRGLGQGTQTQLQFLPEFRTDFIFAAISEELGFLGASSILLLYLFLIAYCLRVAGNSPDYFGFLIATGTAGMLIFQVVVNTGMSVGILPITGVTLPFISYGGSSLISTIIALALVASVARLRRPIDVSSVEGYN